MGIKGPKSALTDFLEEKGIKVKYTSKRQKEESETLLVTRKNKKIYETKPFELINHKMYIPSQQDLALKECYDNFDFKNSFYGESLDLFAKFLAENNKMNLQFFNFLINQSEDILRIYDCSMIKDEFFNFKKSFKIIELINCGQLTEETANNLLIVNKDLEELSLAGAFQLKKLNLPKKLKKLVLDDTKVDDEFIEYLNKNYKKLEKLSLKRCYNLINSVLKVKVKHLNISNTLVNDNFITHSKEIEFLNISNCEFMLNFDKLTNLKHLFLENYQHNINLKNDLISLQIKDSLLKELIIFNNLEYLNVSGINLPKNELIKIKEFKKLKVLDLSWNESVDDSLIFDLVSHLKLEKIFVYGCFNLTEKTGELAYDIFLDTKLIGNPAETKYLLSKTE